MKKNRKTIVALLLVLALCLSLLPAKFSAQAATVDYVYAGSYIKNWGTRDTTATFLSPNAEAFYEKNNITYEELAALSGAASAADVPESALYTALQELMVSNHSHLTGYDETRTMYQYTDCQNSGKISNKISSFYSGVEIGPAWDSGDTWNREHTWPNSKGLEGKDEDDIMMLRPTAKSENNSRSNTAYGESSGYYNPNKLGMQIHGDVARIMLYQYVRWNNTEYMWGTAGVMESREMLLRWMEEDPVDTWEMGRNDAVESITGTRNVFVDYPELAFVLFGEDVPTDYTTPSGKATSGDYRITAVSSDPAWGSVSVSGTNINAIPNTGYEVTGYQLLSGTAQITRKGNVFAVTPSSDVTVKIIFAQRQQAAVGFAQLGVVANTLTAYVSDTIILPGHTGVVQEGYVFLGWVESVVDKTQQQPAFYAVGSTYTLNKSITLHALYAVTESGDTGSNVYVPYTGTLTEGDYLIVYDSAAMQAADTGKSRLNYLTVAVTDGNIVSPDASIVWHIAPSDDYWTMYNASNGKYAAGTGTKNQATLTDSVTDYAKWSCTAGDTYEFVNKGNNDKGINPLLRKNETYGFACYALNTTAGGSLSLYKQVAGTTWYLTGEALVSDQAGNTYETLAVALERVTEAGKLTLLKTVTEDVTVRKNVTIDLAGFCIDGTVTVADGYTLYGMDSRTDDYTVEDADGYGRIAQLLFQGTGKAAGLPVATDVTQPAYLMVTEQDGVSFHRVGLKLVSMSLRAAQVGVYYKSSFAGDEVVARNIIQFGVAMSVDGTPTAQTILTNCSYSAITRFTAGSSSDAASTLLKGIMKQTNTQQTNETNSETVIYGRPYIRTKDNRYLFGSGVERTLRQQTEAADTLWEKLSDSQKETLQQMYTAYKSVMEAWNVPNLQGSMEEEAPVRTGYVQVTSEEQLTDGKYVMLVSTGYAPGVLDGGWLTAVQPVVSDDTVTDTAGGIWTLTFDGSSVILTDANGMTIAPVGGNKNGIKSGSYSWAWSFDDGKMIFAGTGSDTVKLASNTTASGNNLFRGYKNGTVTGDSGNYPCMFTLYKLIES